MYNILEIEIDDPWETLIFGGVKLQQNWFFLIFRGAQGSQIAFWGLFC